MGINKKALVTGSAGGIGLAIANALSEVGFEVVGVDVREAPKGSNFDQAHLDLSDPDAIARFTQRHSEFDVLVNNAAVLVDRSLAETTLDDMQRLFEINMRAPVLLTRELLVGMRQRGWGRIINISSVGARTGGLSDTAVYNMTKAAIAAFTRFTARHEGRHGITSNAIAPGGVLTGMSAHLSQEQLAAFVALIPIGRMAQPEEVAGAAVFLASDSARFVTGVTLDVNGGMVMA